MSWLGNGRVGIKNPNLVNFKSYSSGLGTDTNQQGIYPLTPDSSLAK